MEAISLDWVTDNLTIFLTCLVVILVTYQLILRYAEKRKYPDGPLTLPILGNLVQVALAGDMAQFMEKYRKIYGDVFTVELGGSKRVIISGQDLVQELFIKNADFTSDRTAATMPPNFREYNKVNPGIFWAPSPHWKTMRSFALSVLRDEGMGKSMLEPKIIEEAELYMEHFIEPNLGKPIEMTQSITYATSNIISRMVMGKRFEYDDEQLQRINQALDESVKSNVRAAITQNIPLVKYLPGDLTGYQTIQKAGNLNMNAVSGWVNEELKRMNHSSPKNFIEQALVHSLKEEEKGSKNSCFTVSNTTSATLHLYVAGTETTATALRWALLFMILNPDVQEMVEKEINSEIGERHVSYKDRLNMPYTEAVLLETLRLGNIAPQGLPHTLDKDMVLRGKNVPMGAELMINMTSILHDKVLFPNPKKFDPERFLGPDGAKLKVKVLPFGLGRRACLGEALARMELFLFFTTFMQRYKVRKAENAILSLEPESTIVNKPRIYQIIFEHRHNEETDRL